MAPAIMPTHDTQVMLINFTSYSHLIHNQINIGTATPHHMSSCKTKLDASNQFMQKNILRGF
jgi:hypothetical protein